LGPNPTHGNGRGGTEGLGLQPESGIPEMKRRLSPLGESPELYPFNLAKAMVRAGAWTLPEGSILRL